MATERKSPDAVAASTNLTGTGTIATIQDDPDSPDANWFTATSATAATDLRVTFPSPTGSLTADETQSFRCLIRKTAGTPDPLLTAELRENNTLRKTLFTDTPISSATGTVLQGDWTNNDVTTQSGADIELRLVSTPGSSSSVGALPAYSATGQAAAAVNATLTTTINPAKPSTVNAGDLLILHVLSKNALNNGAGPATITDWTEFAGNPYGGANNSRMNVYWRIAGAGEASQTVAVTCSGSTTNGIAMARIYRFTAADGFDTTPIVSIGSSAGTASPLGGPTVTPTGTNQLAVRLGSIGSGDASVGSMTGESGGNWAEVANANSATGSDGTLNVQTSDQSGGAAISGGTIAFTLSNSGHWTSVGFALVPATGAGSPVNTVEVGAIEWNVTYTAGGAIEQPMTKRLGGVPFAATTGQGVW